jgi:general secretion pathway protein C
MTRAFLDKALEDQAELMHTARFVPEMRDGRIIGVKMFGVREGSTLAQLGMRSGDTLLRISGYDMSSPDKALEAYATLRTRSELDVEILRGGQWMVVRYVLC